MPTHAEPENYLHEIISSKKTMHIRLTVILILLTAANMLLCLPAHSAKLQDQNLETLFANLPLSLSCNCQQQDIENKPKNDIDLENARPISILCRFISTAPVSQRQPRTFLRATLEIITFKSKENRQAAWEKINSQAHPDTGLSYAWDYLILTDSRIYHLHAGCLFSRQLFKRMTEILGDSIINTRLNELFCRCGGGCVTVEQTREK